MTSYQATPYSDSTATHAGFWMRLAAFAIDTILLIIVGLVITFIVRVAGAEGGFAWGITWFIQFIIGAAYFVMMESSLRQATLGKLAVGVKVTDMQGARISAGAAAIRYFSKILSGLILFIGFIMAAFTPKKQALHDIIAKTLVVQL